MMNPESDRKTAQELLGVSEELSDGEARLSIRKRLKKLLEPYVAELDQAIGASLCRTHVIAEEGDWDEDQHISEGDYKTHEYGPELYHVHSFSLGDLFQLVKIRRALYSLDFDRASEAACLVDTAVRERIPENTYHLLRDR